MISGRSAAKTLLEGALDGGVERVEPLQGKCLGRGRTLGAGALCTVVAKHTVLKRHTSLAVQRRRSMGGNQSQPQLDVAQHAPLRRAGDLRAVGILACLADVMHKRSAKQQ